MSRIVLKFGGTSVATPERIGAVADRIAKYVEKGHSVSVVVSAMGDTTDRLLKLAKEIDGERLNARELDQLLATGEQQTISLLSMALTARGLLSRSFTGGQAGITAEGRHTEGRICCIDPARVEAAIARGEVPIIAGFQGSTAGGDVITLGRGGSDLSAIALAIALRADGCHIFTDVDGIYTADPRCVSKARKLKRISYQECLELAVAGARVLQPRSVEMAARAELPVYVASSFSNEEGTWVMKIDVNENLAIRAIAEDSNTARITVFDTQRACSSAAKIYTALSQAGIGAEMIIQNTGERENILYFVKEKDLKRALEISRSETASLGAGDIVSDDALTRLSVVGTGIANHPEITHRIFATLEERGISVESILSSAMSVSCIVETSRAAEAVRVLHERFIERSELKCA